MAINSDNNDERANEKDRGSNGIVTDLSMHTYTSDDTYACTLPHRVGEGERLNTTNHVSPMGVTNAPIKDVPNP